MLFFIFPCLKSILEVLGFSYLGCHVTILSTSRCVTLVTLAMETNVSSIVNYLHMIKKSLSLKTQGSFW